MKMYIFLGRSLVLFIALAFVLSFVPKVFADTTSIDFSDLPQSHWAYNAVKLMVEKGIITGYPDRTFRPDNPVTRAEFARIMVVALNLPIKVNNSPSFIDVPREHWAYPYVETAKYYLTGFRTSNGDYFKPSDYAVREDMAVALVKAKNYQNENVDLSILNNYIDKDQISANLLKYVAIAISKGIMVGSQVPNTNSYKFDPQGILTRAQAAMLLYNIIKVNEEKVTYDQNNQNDNQQNSNYLSCTVSGYIKGDKIVLVWNKIDDRRFKSYKVVISQTYTEPSYPQNGYLLSIDDRNRTYVEISNTMKYNNGDFGDYLQGGKDYYFSITVEYKDNVYIKGNAIKLTMPYNPSYFEKPQVKCEYVNNKFTISWQKIDDARLLGYFVVISKKSKEPKYPDNGYLVYINDKNVTNLVIDNKTPYKGGDFGEYLKEGDEYYFSVTAQYNDRFVAGNTVKAIYFSDYESSKLKPELKGKIYRDVLYLNWNKNESDKFIAYKVVISESNNPPDFNNDGQLALISDRNITSMMVKFKDKYYIGNQMKEIRKGRYYYIVIYAIYNDGRTISSNVLRFKL